MKQKATNTLYQYLEAQGVLEDGTPEDIANARKEYWRQYRAKWRKAKRTQGKEITICLDQTESKLISKRAKEFSLSFNQYVKAAALAHSKREFLQPNASAIVAIREQLILNCSAIQYACEDADLPLDVERLLIDRVVNLEKMLMTELKNIYSIEDAPFHLVQTSPDLKKRILTVLETQ